MLQWKFDSSNLTDETNKQNPTMKRTISNAVSASLLLIAPALTSVAMGEDLHEEAQKAIGVLQSADSGLTNLFSNSPGFVVFPSVGKGGLFFGAEHGNGV